MLTALVCLAAAKTSSCCSGMAQFLSDPAFIASHIPPKPFVFQSKDGSMITFKDAKGEASSGYYVPAKKGNHNAILMVHEWWGLNDYIKREAVKLHDELGVAVLAVDLYEGKVAATAEDAGKYMGQVKEDRATAIVGGAIQALKTGAVGAKAHKIGTIGWCFGGGWSHRAAIQGGPNVQACVMYYGMPDTDPQDLKRLRAPVLMVWAKKDKWINEKVVTGFKAAMKTAHKPLTVLAYNADHGFANPSNPKFDKAATASAHKAEIAFFRAKLK